MQIVVWFLKAVLINSCAGINDTLVHKLHHVEFCIVNCDWCRTGCLISTCSSSVLCHICWVFGSCALTTTSAVESYDAGIKVLIVVYSSTFWMKKYTDCCRSYCSIQGDPSNATAHSIIPIYSLLVYWVRIRVSVWSVEPFSRFCRSRTPDLFCCSLLGNEWLGMAQALRYWLVRKYKNDNFYRRRLSSKVAVFH